METGPEQVPEGNDNPNGEADVPDYMPDDMGQEDLIALFVLDDIPIEVQTFLATLTLCSRLL